MTKNPKKQQMLENIIIKSSSQNILSKKFNFRNSDLLSENQFSFKKFTNGYKVS